MNNNINQIKKIKEKNIAYISHNNNLYSKKNNCQNYTTKIITNHKRTNKFLNNCNLNDKRKAHSSSISKHEKYNLNSLIQNDNLYNNMMNDKKNNSPSNKIKKNSKSNFYDHHVNNIITLNNCLYMHFQTVIQFLIFSIFFYLFYQFY